MSRHSRNVDLELDKEYKISIGGKEVILTSAEGEELDKLPVKEIYVSKSTGRLVIVFKDAEEIKTGEVKFSKPKKPKDD